MRVAIVASLAFAAVVGLTASASACSMDAAGGTVSNVISAVGSLLGITSTAPTSSTTSNTFVTNTFVTNGAAGTPAATGAAAGGTPAATIGAVGGFATGAARAEIGRASCRERV